MSERPDRRVDPSKQAELEVALILISRAIRDKLDRVGIKLRLREWQALSLEERTRLRDARCESVVEVGNYGALVDELVQQRTGKHPDRLAARDRHGRT